MCWWFDLMLWLATCGYVASISLNRCQSLQRLSTEPPDSQRKHFTPIYPHPPRLETLTLTIHTLLPDRPATSGLANTPLDWFKSNLTENTYVQFTPLCSGVLQGSVLGPLPLLLTSLLPLGKIFHSFDRPGSLLCRWHQALPVHMHSFLFLMYGVKCKMQSSSSLSEWAAAIRLNQACGVRLQCYVKVRKQWRVQSEKSLQEINSAKLCVCLCVCVSACVRMCVCLSVVSANGRQSFLGESNISRPHWFWNEHLRSYVLSPAAKFAGSVCPLLRSYLPETLLKA